MAESARSIAIRLVARIVTSNGRLYEVGANDVGIANGNDQAFVEAVVHEANVLLDGHWTVRFDGETDKFTATR